VLILGPTIILILTGLFTVVDIVVFRVGLRLFQREEILSQTK
jgi:hypothetical protein